MKKKIIVCIFMVLITLCMVHCAFADAGCGKNWERDFLIDGAYQTITFTCTSHRTYYEHANHSYYRNDTHTKVEQCYSDQFSNLIPDLTHGFRYNSVKGESEKCDKASIKGVDYKGSKIPLKEACRYSGSENLLVTYECSVCKHSCFYLFESFDHVLVGDEYVTLEPTCTEKGYKERMCKNCNTSRLSSFIPATGHTEEIDAAVAATCTTEGKTEGKHCSVCNTVLVAQETVPATGHTEEIDAAVSATCTTEGKTEGKHCSVCNTVLVAQETVPATGHTEEIDAAVAATCTTEGKTEGKHCSVCNTVLVAQETVPATGHTEEIDAAVAATCTTEGKTEGKHCSVCDTVLVAQETVPATSHTEVIDAAVAATCTTEGKTEGKHCSVCDTVLVERETVPATGHTEEIDAAVAATCTTEGKTEGKHCSVCDTVLVAQETVSATGHTEVIDAAVAATCTTEGKTEGKHCSVCDTVLVERETVPATGHTEVIDAAVAATCTTEGKTEGKHCSVCGTVLVRQETIPAKVHYYQPWSPVGEHHHTAPCFRKDCTHIGSTFCTWYEVLVDDKPIFVCPVCGEWNNGVWEIVADATCESIDQYAIPDGELVVRGSEMPLTTVPVRIDGIDEALAPLYGMTVAYERGGHVKEFEGLVRVSVSMATDAPFRLVLLNDQPDADADANEIWTDIPFSLENGMLSFETDQAGLFLLLPVD